MKNNMIHTNEEMKNALKEAGIPVSVCEAITEVYSVAEIRPIVNGNDVATLKANIKNVGVKRAEIIIDALKGKFPAPMSQPVPDLRAPDVEMYEIPQLDLVYDEKSGKAGLVLHKDEKKLALNPNTKIFGSRRRFGPAFQMLQKISGVKNPAIFTTVSEIPMDLDNPVPSYAKEQCWNNAVHNGIKCNNKKYMPLLMGTNAKKDCKLNWCEEQFVEAVRNWVNCGANLNSDQNVAKIEAYHGLCLPFTHPLLNGILNPSMEVITPSWENVHSGKNLVVEPDGETHWEDKYVVNEFDGQVIIELTDKIIAKLRLTRQERRKLIRAINKFNGGTLRGPWHKGVIVWGFHIHDYLHSIGVHTIGGRDIDEIAIFGDQTTFKAAIGKGKLYEKFSDFTENFNKLQHRFGVLLENHGIKKTFLPAQQLQAAHWALPGFIQDGAKEEISYLNSALNPTVSAERYEPKTIAKIAKVDSSIMSTWFATELANNGYKKEREAALSGRTHGNSVSGFCIKDVIAYCEWLAYKEGVRTELPTGVLKKYEVYAQTAEFTGKAVASRNPVIANYGLHVVDVIERLPDSIEQYFDEGFDYIMVGIHDDLCKLLRMDHDGDKARLTYAPWFVNAVASIRHDGAFAEWESFGPVKKVPPTYAASLDMFATCTATPTLGLNVDACGKMISNGIVKEQIQEMAMDYLMNKGTDVKQGADGSNVGGEIGAVWSAMVNANKTSKYSIAQATGKGLKGRALDAKNVATKYGDSNLDIIAKAVSENAAKELKFNGEFAIEKVLINKPQVIKGLCGSGTWDETTQEYLNQGLFNTLAQRSSKEWSLIDEDVQKTSWQEWSAWKKAQAIKELTAYVESIGKTVDDMYDALTTYVFLTLKKQWYAQNASEKKRNWLIILVRTYLEWFGDRMEAAFCENGNLDCLPAVEVDLDFDDDSIE